MYVSCQSISTTIATPKCIDTNSYYITPICINLYTIINALNETGDAYSLELSPTFCRSVCNSECFPPVYSFLLDKTH